VISVGTFEDSSYDTHTELLLLIDLRRVQFFPRADFDRRRRVTSVAAATFESKTTPSGAGQVAVVGWGVPGRNMAARDDSSFFAVPE
jgi:hypothetical protein